MFKLTITKQLFWIVSAFLILSNFIGSVYLYKQTQELITLRATFRSNALENYFLSMRKVYHHQFLQSGFEVNETTVGFLPAHASSLISELFEKRMGDGTSIRNVSNNARNPLNKANRFEEEAIRYYIQNPDVPSKIEIIKEDGREFFFYSAPLKVEGYCISCHGAKGEVLDFIARKYDTAFGYKEGDVRGVTSIKIPLEQIRATSMQNFWNNILFNWSVLFLLLALVYYVIRELTLKDVKAKQLLESEVKKKTASLQAATQELLAANRKQKHLFSILRTVADCNQVLITALSLDELLEQTAQILQANSAFDGVKIMALEEGELVVKVSLGLDEEMSVFPLEQKVFDTKSELSLKSFDPQLPKECLDKVQRHNIKEVYCMPLTKDTYAKKALGVITICSKQEEGLADEEQEMMRELAGDIGFAMNSFLQKEMIHKLSNYHPLTNLLNKRYLVSFLEKMLADMPKSAHYCALFYINIDNFKAINDLVGIVEADAVLLEFSQRLFKQVQNKEMLFHIGGDEFAVIFENIDQNMQQAVIKAQKEAQRLVQIINKPFLTDAQTIYVTMSMGVVLFHSNEMNHYALLNSAESAMHLAKDSGKNGVRFFDHDSQELAVLRSSMMQDLQDAFAQEQFYVEYQKQVDQNHKVVGVEVLVRWQHPTLGVVPPMKFIPLIEEAGRISELGNWIIEQSLLQLLAWQNDPLRKEWRISINVSPLQFNKEEFMGNLQTLVTRYKVDPHKLRIEITEGVLISDITLVTQKIALLKELGFSISIDDFGTGYSSLSYLKNLDIDELKIDQSFVFNLTQSQADKTIVKTIIAMGDAFGLEVIAEGVETQEHFEILKSLGCDNFQGYYFGRPQRAQDL